MIECMGRQCVCVCADAYLMQGNQNGGVGTRAVLFLLLVWMGIT